MAGRTKSLSATIRPTMPSHAPAGNTVVLEAEDLTTHLLNQAGDMIVHGVRITTEVVIIHPLSVMSAHLTQTADVVTTGAVPAAHQATLSHVVLPQEEAAASRQDQIAAAEAVAAPLAVAPAPRQEAAALDAVQEAALRGAQEAARQAAQEEAQAVEEEINSFIN